MNNLKKKKKLKATKSVNLFLVYTLYTYAPIYRHIYIVVGRPLKG